MDDVFLSQACSTLMRVVGSEKTSKGGVREFDSRHAKRGEPRVCKGAQLYAVITDDRDVFRNPKPMLVDGPHGADRRKVVGA